VVERIFVVEDEFMLRANIERGFARVGHVVMRVVSAGDVWLALESLSFDVFITDLCFFDGSGMDFIVDCARFSLVLGR
jgi:Response regulator containing CheY-like receiver, AAA-type ATPase, and DNA-binding domains